MAQRVQLAFPKGFVGQLDKAAKRKLVPMPVISKFYGIVIRMLFARALTARFHAIYGDSELVVRISPLSIIQGDAPQRVQSLVLEWARDHQSELLADWERCARAEMPVPITPLS
jgi:hypothetical protein